MKGHIIHIDAAKCIGCCQCQRDCPASNITVVGKKASLITQDCIKCGHCAAICPAAAIAISGFPEPPEEIEGPVILNPQQLLGALKTRRSIRQFTSRPITQEILTQIIEAGRWTPTAKNAQDVSYLLLQDDIERCEGLAVRLFRRLLPVIKLGNPTAKRTVIDEHFFFKKAPAAIVVLSRNVINGALAASNMELMAQAHGLGVLYSGFFTMAVNHSRALRKALGLKRNERAVTTLVLGYSSAIYHRTVQKEAADVRTL